MPYALPDAFLRTLVSQRKLSAGEGAVTLGARRSSLTVRQYSPCCTAIQHGGWAVQRGITGCEEEAGRSPKDFCSLGLLLFLWVRS